MRVLRSDWSGGSDTRACSGETHHGTIQRDHHGIEKMAIHWASDIQLPGFLFVPKTSNGQRYLHLHGEGKHVDASKGGPIEELVLRGGTVLAVDLRGIGETKTTDRDVMISYLLGKSLVGMRSEDVLIAARVLSEWKKTDKSSEVHLIASGSAEVPAIHAAALERKLFSSLKINGDVPSWSRIVRDPTEGRLSDTVHGALTVYDLPDLVSSYHSFRKQNLQQ